jgi:hypothetical protein
VSRGWRRSRKSPRCCWDRNHSPWPPFRGFAFSKIWSCAARLSPCRCARETATARGRLQGGRGVKWPSAEAAYPFGLKLRRIAACAGPGNAVVQDAGAPPRSDAFRLTLYAWRFAAITGHGRVYQRLFPASPVDGIVLAESACGYPVVHHPPVTLSNHTILENGPYNDLVQRTISEIVNRHGRLDGPLVRELPQT